MLGRFLADHFWGAVILLSLMAIILGIIGTYVSMFILAVLKMVDAAYIVGFLYG